MTDKPIIFSGPMVRSLLAGQKSQTRRIIGHGEDIGIAMAESGRHLHTIGDRLWVRESATRFDKGTCDQHIWFHAGRNEIYPWLDKNFPGLNPDAPWPHPEGPGGGAPYITPSIFMPRWASRITLTVTEVRVQRLQDISEEDAIAEGVERVEYPGVGKAYIGMSGWKDYRDHPHAIVPFIDAKNSYETLWDSINGKKAPWATNPFVVAVTFSVVKQNIDEVAACA